MKKFKLRVSGSPILYGSGLDMNYTQGEVRSEDLGLLEDYSALYVDNMTVGVPPVVMSATSDADGDTIVITFDKSMQDPTGKHAQFTFTEGGTPRTFNNAALEVDTTKIRLTVDGASIISGTVLLLNYTQGVNPVRATDGGLLANFISQSVTNIVTSAPALVEAVTSIDGTLITCEFTKVMANPIGKHLEFTFRQNSTTRAFSSAVLNVDTHKIDLTVSGGLPVYGDTLDVSYTKGTVLAADGGVLESFSQEPVVNNVAGDPPILLSGSTDDAGLNLYLIFDKDMEDPATKFSHFSFRVNGAVHSALSAVWAGGPGVTEFIYQFSISAVPLIVYGDVVDATYTPGDVTSQDGGILAGFINQTVDNVTLAEPPIFVDAVTSSNGDRIIVEFDKAMSNPVGFHAQFYFHENGIQKTFSSAALEPDTKKIRLMVANTFIANGQSVSVSYNGSSVTSTDTGILETFINETVTNQVSSPPTFVSSETNEAGSLIYVTFSKNMENPTSKYGLFSFRINGTPRTFSSAGYGGSNDIVVFSVSGSPLVVYSDVVDITYTPGTFYAEDGGLLGGFINETVDNTVRGVPPVVNGISLVNQYTVASVDLTFDKTMAAPGTNYDNFKLQISGYTRDTTFGSISTPGTDIYRLGSNDAIVRRNQTGVITYTDGTVESFDRGILQNFTGLSVPTASEQYCSWYSYRNVASQYVEAVFNQPVPDLTPYLSDFTMFIDSTYHTPTSVTAINETTVRFYFVGAPSFDATESFPFGIITSGTAFNSLWGNPCVGIAIYPPAQEPVGVGTAPEIKYSTSNSAGTYVDVVFSKTMTAPPATADVDFRIQKGFTTMPVDSVSQPDSYTYRFNLSGASIIINGNCLQVYYERASGNPFVYATDGSTLVGGNPHIENLVP